jgi:tellurite resistance protein TehA-like permease
MFRGFVQRRGDLLVAAAQAVMGTSIVSVDLRLHGFSVPSAALMWIAVAIWAALILGLAAATVSAADELLPYLDKAGSLSLVAGTAVLGTRLAQQSWDWAGIAALAIAIAFWVVLFPAVLRSRRAPTTGSDFLLTVSTASLGVLFSQLCLDLDVQALLVPALVLLVLAALLYAAVAIEFDRRELLHGRGDHWVAGGGLAILALATGEAGIASQHVEFLSAAEHALRVAGWILWPIAIVWLVALVVAEVAQPRLRIELRRWATVFPVGMFAACSFTLGRFLDAPAISDFARAWTWVAIASWALVLAGTIAAPRRLLRFGQG